MSENDEMFPDEDDSGIATINTVLKMEEKPKKETKKESKEELFYKELKGMWESFKSAHAIGNLTGAQKKFNKVIDMYEREFLNG